VGSNPLEARMSDCVYSVFVLSGMYVATLRRADHLSKESYHLSKKHYKTEKEARTQQSVVEPLMMMMMMVMIMMNLKM
jgi:hypothetical protein